MGRKWYDSFRQCWAEGKVVCWSWFRQNAKLLFVETYSRTILSQFCFSNRWFWGFLSWHRITLGLITNRTSHLPVDYIEVLVNWMKFNQRNWQLRLRNLSTLPDTRVEIGRYRLSNICNMDLTALHFKYLSCRAITSKGKNRFGYKEVCSVVETSDRLSQRVTKQGRLSHD